MIIVINSIKIKRVQIYNKFDSSGKNNKNLLNHFCYWGGFLFYISARIGQRFMADFAKLINVKMPPLTLF